MSTQLSLLNQPRARHDDPDTSRAAAASVQPAAPLLETLIRQVVEAYRGHATAETIAHDIGSQFPGRWVDSTIRGAVSRAAENGVIVPCGEGKTSRGMRARLYRSAP